MYSPSTCVRPGRLAAGLLAAPAALALLLAACSTHEPPPGSIPSTSGAAYETDPGYGGQVFVESVTLTNRIVSFNAAKHQISLKHEDGTVGTYKTGPAPAGFGPLQPGDLVVVRVVEQVAVFAKPSNSPQIESSSALNIRATSNGQATDTSIDALSFTAKVAAMDYVLDVVTLQMPDGSLRSVHVSEYVNLADFNVGDEISVRVTEATAVSIDKVKTAP